MKIPQRSGFYWAKWRTAEQDAGHTEVLPLADEWEVVWVFENGADPEDEEFLRVFVTGVEATQPVWNFEWGSGPLKLPARAAR